MSAGGWILSILWTLIIIALVIAGALWLIASLRGRETTPSTRSAPEPSAREILDRRLAGGELTIAEYEHLRDTIDRPGGGADASRSAHPVDVSG